MFLSVFFFNATATTEIYTLSLHDALPILVCSLRTPRDGWYFEIGRCMGPSVIERSPVVPGGATSRHLLRRCQPRWSRDRKSTRLNSSHSSISYAVFCLKKKKTTLIHCQPS